jgi:acid phosphatase (class A)
MKKRFLVLLFAAAFIMTGVVAPDFNTETKKPTPLVDLTQLLPPPPPQDSPQTKAEIQEIKNYQTTRTKDQIAYAQADVEVSVFRFKNVLGAKFTAENLPLTAALFDKALKFSKDCVMPVKDFYNRPRPYVCDPTVKPCLKLETSPAYPSGHSTAGTLMAILLANMVPEKKTEIFKRGWEFALNRVIGGVHYRSDMESGHISGTVIAAFLMKDKRFMKEFSAAKAELRRVLGYQK